MAYQQISENTTCLNCSQLVSLTSAKSLMDLNDKMACIVSELTEATRVHVVNNPELARSSKNLEAQKNMVYTIPLENNFTVSIIAERPKFALNQALINDITKVYINIYRALAVARTDKLTGLLNRHSLEEKMQRLLINHAHDTRAKRTERVLVIFDIDHFKTINDSFGHVFGDEVLLRISQTAKEVFRVDDWVFRFGGEEFVVLLQDTIVTDAFATVERFREKISELSFPAMGKVTISLGMSQLNYRLPLAANLDRADKALYYAKEHGRNQTVIYEQMENRIDDSKKEINDDIELF